MAKSSSNREVKIALSRAGSNHTYCFVVLFGATLGLTQTKSLKDYKRDLCI